MVTIYVYIEDTAYEMVDSYVAIATNYHIIIMFIMQQILCKLRMHVGW